MDHLLRRRSYSGFARHLGPRSRATRGATRTVKTAAGRADGSDRADGPGLERRAGCGSGPLAVTKRDGDRDPPGKSCRHAGEEYAPPRGAGWQWVAVPDSYGTVASIVVGLRAERNNTP